MLDLEQKFKDLTCLQDLKKKRQDLTHQSAWAQVAELEKVRGHQCSLDKIPLVTSCGKDIYSDTFFSDFKNVSKNFHNGIGTIMAMTDRWADKQKKHKQKNCIIVYTAIS